MSDSWKARQCPHPPCRARPNEPCTDVNGRPLSKSIAHHSRLNPPTVPPQEETAQ
ncbi:hypothetical protein GCM10022221_67750 [Actinocorallia aurea]